MERIQHDWSAMFADQQADHVAMMRQFLTELQPADRLRIAAAIQHLLSLAIDGGLLRGERASHYSIPVCVMVGAPVAMEIISTLPCPHLPQLVDCAICCIPFSDNER